MATKKHQVLFIHGGETFRTQRAYRRFLRTRKIDISGWSKWSGSYLDAALGKKFCVIRPRMPLGDNARYADWKIHFERHIPYLHNNLILIGSSLGGIFLAKYLSENKFPNKIVSVYLVCPPFDDTLPHERLAGGFRLKSDLSKLEKCTKNLHLLFSKNDDVVPVSHAKKYARKLPKAHITIYNHIEGHFRVTKFSEIVRMIMQDVRRK